MNLYHSSIGSDNGLVPTRRQGIIWTNADPICWHIYAAPGEMSLTWCLSSQAEYFNKTSSCKILSHCHNFDHDNKHGHSQHCTTSTHLNHIWWISMLSSKPFLSFNFNVAKPLWIMQKPSQYHIQQRNTLMKLKATSTPRDANMYM